MAGGPANIVSGPVVSIGLPTLSKTQMKILCLHPKSTWKLRVCPQNPHQNPLFDSKTILPIWSRPFQTKTLCRPLLATGGTNWVTDSLELLRKKTIVPVVDKAVAKSADVVIELALLLFRVFADFEGIKKELERMQGLLKDAEFKQNTVEGVEKWGAEDVRDVSYEVDDVIDNIAISCRTEERSPAVAVVGHVERFISQLKTRISIAWRILIINLKIRDILRMREFYSTIRDINDEERQEATRPSISSRQEHWQFYSDVKEPEVVGQEEEINTLREQLISEEPRRRRVISILGMAGSGKTTLAKKVYEYDDVKTHFECRAFITVSQHYIIKDVLMSITKCVMLLSPEETEGLSRLTEKELGVKVRDHLKNKRYLVVIDDIWSKVAWDDMLEPILPDVEKKSSRVILTTRIEEVASNANSSSCLFQMRLLNNEEGWELFKNKIFGGEVRLSELEETKLREILAKCGGLPLAILALGGLLRSKKKTFTVWSEVLDSVNKILIDRSNKCGEILALCYSDLPPYLKPCFLYFGLFPEDYEIDSEEIIRLWIAEGFIQQKDNEIMEGTAQDYLEKLVDRSMIQASRKRSNGSIAKCRIHDLFRDLSISKAEQNKFFTIHDVEGTCSFSSTTSVRRLALHRSINGYCPTVTLRSLLSFHDCDFSHSEIRVAKSLRVMRVRGEDFMFLRKMTSIMELIHPKFQWVMSEGFKEFVHLRYLELIEVPGFLPSSIGDLNNLQTLVLNESPCFLPAAISNLEQLRHLCALYTSVGNLQVNKLTNLQTLCLPIGNWIKDGFGNLTNLRELYITGDEGINEAILATLPDSIGKLHNLRSLTLIHDGTGFLPQLMPFTHHSHLYEMSLYGAMKELPDFPPNLVKLTLGGNRLEEAAISKLEKLSHPKILQLRTDSYKGEKMICSAGSFPQLEILIMVDLPLKEWIIEEGAMPSLKSVHLIRMHFLNTQTLPKRVHALLKHDTWEYR